MTLRDNIESKLGPLSDLGLMESTTDEIMKVILEFFDEEIKYMDDTISRISDIYDLPRRRELQERRSAINALKARIE